MVRYMVALGCVFALGACGDEGDGATYRGTVSASAEEGEFGDRWVLFVELDGARVGGSATVQVAFDETELSCANGAELRPDQVEVDADITFVRAGDDYDAMSPPGIGGRSVEVSC